MRTSFNVPDDLVEEFDRVWREEGIENRSRAVREAMREYVESYARLESTSGEVVALLGFDYRRHDVIEPLHSVQHEYQDVICNTSHTHQGEWCLESLFCRDAAERVRRVKIMVVRDGDGG